MKRILLLLLCLTLIGSLLGCDNQDKPYVPTGDGLTWDEDYTGPVYTQPQDSKIQELSLPYYANQSMNPYLCTDFTNRTLFPLLYQSLFTVDRNYRVEPLLCKNYRVSADMKTYTFYPESATFSNGSRLTALDIAESLKAAKESKLYQGRLYRVSEITLTEDGGVQVQLNTPYEDFCMLLDIPILQASQIALERPLGSGPYILDVSGRNAVLRRRTDWWCAPKMALTAPVISLEAAESPTHIRDEFQFGDLNMVCADPGSDHYSDFRSDYELWDCENGIFLYLTVCDDSLVFSDPDVRTALTHAIDRELLADDYYRGFARPATLPASPLSPYYSQVLASRYEYEPEKFAQVIRDKELTDSPVVLLVNNDDSLRRRVAFAIEDMLEEAGLQVEVKTLSGDDYTYTLTSWQFDLYLGQTILSPNMDLSHFFSSSGNLRYGGVNDVSAYALCLQSLENHGNYYTLHQTIMDNGLLCPILFRSYAVYADRGIISGLTPSRDNVFYYSIGKTMDEALIKE